MFLALCLWLSQYIHALQVVHYLTFRSLLSLFTAFVLSLILGPPMIQSLSGRQLGQIIREDGPLTHLSKSGTPTMGGLLIVLTLTLSSLLWGDWHSSHLWIMLLTVLAFACLGGMDDFLKLKAKNSRGLWPRYKLLGQSVFAMLAALALVRCIPSAAQTSLYVPFFKGIVIPLGALSLPFFMLVIVGTSNAVNLTDGLDGLAIFPCVCVAAAMGIFAYLSGHAQFASYLDIPFLSGLGELCIFSGALVGAGLGFLWFNTYPAQVFMGDLGSLAVGSALGLLAVMVRQELLLVWMGGIFVVETLSVMMQVISFRLTGRRVFRMAPLHHHFELKGWPEPRVIVRFWIVSLMLVLSGLATLKLR